MQSDQILVKFDRNPLGLFSKEDMVKTLKEKLSGRVLQAFIFGSFYSNKFNHDSDIDLLLIVETSTPYLNRASEFFDLLDLGPRFDILVYTPSEFATQISHSDVGFWKSVKQSLHQIL